MLLGHDFIFVLGSQKKSVVNDFLWPCTHLAGNLSVF